MDFLETVSEKYEEMSPIQKRIADYIFTYPDEVSFGSLKAFSNSLGVTEVTILRFVKKIGLSSFVELKTCLRECMRNHLYHGQSLPLMTDYARTTVYEEHDKGDLFREFVANEQQVLKDTYEQVSVTEIIESASMIKQARQVYTISGELTRPIAAYMTRRLLSIGVKVFDLGNVSRANYNNYVSSIGPEDVVIVYSFPGYVKEIINTTKYLGENQVPIILISNKRSAPAASYATRVLLCNNHDLFFYNSMLGAFSVSSMLAYFAAMQNQEETSRLQGKLLQTRKAIESSETEERKSRKQ